MTTAFNLRHQGCFTSSTYELPSQGLCGYCDEERVYPKLVQFRNRQNIQHAAVHPRKGRRLAVETLPLDVLELVLTRVST
jgi:hypothetical protein